MRRILTFLLLAGILSAGSAFAAPLSPVICNLQTLAQCNTISNPGNGTQGQPAWLAFGTLNTWGSQLGLFANDPANEILATPNGTTGIPALRQMVEADILPALPTLISGDCLANNGTALEWLTCGTGGSGVTSLSGDGALITNSASTGAVTLTLGSAPGYGVWGNDTSSTGAPSYVALSSWPLAAFPTGLAQLATAQTWTALQTFNAGLTASGLTLSGVTGSVQCLEASSTGVVSGSGAACGTSAMVYPSAGIANSTGTAWGTSYTTSGSGTVIPLTVSPVFTTPSLGAATATSINGTSIPSSQTLLYNGGPGGTAYNTLNYTTTTTLACATINASLVNFGVSGTMPTGVATWTLPAAGSSGCGAGFSFDVYNPSTYALTVASATLAAPTNGALTATAGGTLAATTYYVESTWVNANGETIGSAETSLAVAANDVLNVAAPGSAPTGATGWNVYVTVTSGSYTTAKQNTTAIALGTAWVEPTTGLVSGAAIPATNTAYISLINGSGTLAVAANTGASITTDVGGTFYDVSACTACIPSGGSGTVNSGTAAQLAYYGATGTAVSGTPQASISSSTLTLGSSTSAGTIVLGDGHGSGTVHISVTGSQFGTTNAIGFSSYLTSSLPIETPYVESYNNSATASIAGTGACATLGTIVGGPTAGQFSCTGTTGASTITITLPGGSAALNNGLACWMHDITTPANTLAEGANTTTSDSFSGTVNANDVIRFGCIGY